MERAMDPLRVFIRTGLLATQASSGRSVSWRGTRKMAHEKIGANHGAGRLLATSLSLLYFALTQLTE